VGGWKNNEKHGKGTFTYKDGCVYEGKWKNGVVKYTHKKNN